MATVTPERLKELLSYDPLTGIWTWRASGPGRRASGVAGCWLHKSGYVQIAVDGRLYLSHRLAWLYMTGAWPEYEVDHIDGVPGHDWWSNLRAATISQNRRNTRGHRDSLTGIRGVYWAAERGVYHAKIYLNGKLKFLGSFKDSSSAELARRSAELEYFGEFSSLHRQAATVSQAPNYAH